MAVARANVAIAKYCVDGSNPDGVIRGIDTLTDLYRKYPDALYQPGGEGAERTMREVLADAANTLEPCAPDQARQLDRVLDAS